MRAKVVTVMRWYAQDEVNQEDSEQNEVDGMKKGADNKDHISETIRDWGLVPKDHQHGMAYGESNVHVSDDVAWPRKDKNMTPNMFGDHYLNNGWRYSLGSMEHLLEMTSRYQMITWPMT